MSLLWRRAPRVGDVVRLLSGGPDMTVMYVCEHSADGKVVDRWTIGTCWFADGEVLERQFDSDIVRLVPLPSRRRRS